MGPRNGEEVHMLPQAIRDPQVQQWLTAFVVGFAAGSVVRGWWQRKVEKWRNKS